jgi:hypothetical protein
MEKRWTLIRALLLVMSFFSFQSASLMAQSTVFLISSNWKQTNLTHTVFHGSNHHYAIAPFTMNEENVPGGFGSSVGRPERGPFPWKYNIVATVFWVGEQAAEGNPVSNLESAWDPSWVTHYGGEDKPDNRANFLPVTFTPKQNPFYVALPYNDVDNHHTRPEAAKVIPWFHDTFVRDGQSVCKDSWVAIRHGKHICYAQWEDVGPFQIDHWQYVFGIERPRPNSNHDAGIDVSPAVREYLSMSGMDACDWKFVNSYEVPNGPWMPHKEYPIVARLRHRAHPAVVGQ